MIDPTSFERICCLSKADLGGTERSDLLTLLAVEEEVLPYLLVKGSAFTDWHQSRAALKRAIRGMTRALQVRPVGHPSGFSLQQRQDLRHALKAAVAACELAPSADNALTEPMDLNAHRSVNAFRTSAGQDKRDPHVFISAE
jgi:hypothetical protein